jgi:hypothetical protein
MVPVDQPKIIRDFASGWRFAISNATISKSSGLFDNNRIWKSERIAKSLREAYDARATRGGSGGRHTRWR